MLQERTRSLRVTPIDAQDSDEPFTTRTSRTPLRQRTRLSLTSDVKRAITLGENFLESSVPCYDQIIKSRVKTFFDELTPLLMIDNAYRGIHDANDYTTKMWSETATDSADTTAKINSFLSELAILISEDNIYRGYHKTAEEVQAS